MSRTTRCPCGVVLHIVDATAETVSCPKCNRMLRVIAKPSGDRPVSDLPQPTSSNDSTLVVACSCGTRLRLASSAIGKQVRCPKCTNVFNVQTDSPPSPMQSVSSATPLPSAPGPSPSDAEALGFDLNSNLNSNLNSDMGPDMGPDLGSDLGSGRGFDLDFDSLPSAPPAPSVVKSVPAKPVRTTQTRSHPRELPGIGIVKFAMICLLVGASLLAVSRLGAIGAAKVRNAQVDSISEQKPTSYAESEALREQYEQFRERFGSIRDGLHYVEIVSRVVSLVALIGCGVGFAMISVNVPGTVRAIGISIAVIALVLAAIEGVTRTVRVLQYDWEEPIPVIDESTPADFFYLLVVHGTDKASVVIPTSLEVLRAILVMGVGIFFITTGRNRSNSRFVAILLCGAGGVYLVNTLLIAMSFGSATLGRVPAYAAIGTFVSLMILVAAAALAVATTWLDDNPKSKRPV